MSFDDHGWQVFAPEDAVAQWVAHARPYAVQAAADPANHPEWLRCGGTWFVGVDALGNDAEGQIEGGPQLKGAAVGFATNRYGKLPLHRAQVSVIYPDYPNPMDIESAAAFKFRRDRDAAHVDGLLPVGPKKRRLLQEPHAYVLGMPFSDATASPLVVWDGSHRIMAQAFRAVFEGVAPSDWATIDLTEIYRQARAQCFKTCERREIYVPTGGSYLVHRHTLHGVAPWKSGDFAPNEGRMIAYFRPEFPSPAKWLTAD